MSTFEIIGIEFQYNARTIQEAQKSFDKSCDRCCNQGYNIPCEHCHIAAAHNNVVSILKAEV